MLNSRELHFTSDKPYPAQTAVEKNKLYGKWMLDNMGGIHSEMSAISLYVYNSFIIDEHYEDVVFVFEKVSMIEMRHLKMFGQMAYSLGEDPRLWSQNRNRKVYWSPGYNQYTADLKGLMYKSLEGELGAMEKYRRQADSCEDENVCALLERIILDEEIHADIFRQIIRIYQL